ncbi:MAG TPA: GTP 3',8-cyclase MoaA [Candidatus Latescibacteria bacterium]|jgi:cyclic pyranopterin phosphate synthase|nr:GTP 3',8-cyclase MoaA [Candidatus Latescibacterota bacterium]
MSTTYGPRPAPPATATTDTLGRPLQSLRISVIDRCDLRCAYCMPEQDYSWLPKSDILTFEEILTLTDAFIANGVHRVRLTGGEPLLRAGLEDLVAGLVTRKAIEDVALTTNATQLAKHAVALHDAGLRRVTVSLDSLKASRFETLTRRAALDDVIGGIEAAAAVGFEGLKINTVVMRDFNDDELVDMLEFGRRVGAEVRFIEYMDVGGATQWSHERVVSRQEILDQLAAHFGPIAEVGTRGHAPAERFVLPTGQSLGIISSTTQPFCRDCDRSRLTADGFWFLCLYAAEGIDLRQQVRRGASSEELSQLITDVWRRRTDRGAEQRAELEQRGALFQIEELRQDPRREMHTRGG